MLKTTRLSGTATGTQVASTLRDYAKRAQSAMREQRATSFKTAHLLTQNFATLASGILIGMSEGLGAKRLAAKGTVKTAKGRKTTKAARVRDGEDREAPQDYEACQDCCGTQIRIGRSGSRQTVRAATAARRDSACLSLEPMALANTPDCRRKGQHPERVRASGAAPVGANMLQYPFRLSAGCPASQGVQHATSC